jgi:uncharacterized protein (DUF2249 family)
MEGCIMSQADTPAQVDTATPVLATYPFDARAIAKRFRHAAIFGALEVLGPGEAMRFVNDHNPLPLLRQMNDHFGDTVVVEYRENCEAGVIIDFIKVA